MTKEEKANWDSVFEVEALCREIRKSNMQGLNKFKTEIKTEVDKVTDKNKKKYITEQANAIITHIESVCDEEYDALLNQPHKSFRRMWKFVTEHAREYAVDNCAMVADSVVYGWIDEYVGLDDKDEVEKEEKESKDKAINIKKTIEKAKAKTTPEQASIFDLM